MSDPSWDDDKRRRNLMRHRVDFIDAASALEYQHGVTWYDHSHSMEEDRYVTIGTARIGQVLVVVTSLDESGRTRIISARRATKRERNAYQARTPLD